MKLSTHQLKQIIKEELRKVLRENHKGGDVERIPDAAPEGSIATYSSYAPSQSAKRFGKCKDWEKEFNRLSERLNNWKPAYDEESDSEWVQLNIQQIIDDSFSAGCDWAVDLKSIWAGRKPPSYYSNKEAQGDPTPKRDDI